MDTNVLVAIIAGIVGTLSGFAAILSAILSYRKVMALLEYRMMQVEKKLDSHNGYAKMFTETSEKINQIEIDVAVIKAEVKYIGAGKGAES